MQTATGTRSTQQPEVSQDVSFETRLELAHIAMDVALSRHHDTQEAREAVSEALAEAARYNQALTSREAARRPNRPNDVLSRAAGIIRAQGLSSGCWTDPTGAVCAREAIRLAAQGNAWAEREAVNELMARIEADLGHDAYSIPGWNDSRGMTDVLRLLR